MAYRRRSYGRARRGRVSFRGRRMRIGNRW